MSSAQYWETAPHSALTQLARNIKSTHLRELLKDEHRNAEFLIEAENVLLDFSREKLTKEVLERLLELADACGLQQSITKMFEGELINKTEKRAVLHVALRAAETDDFKVDGVSVVGEVRNVLQRIRDFSDRVRSGQFCGFTGKALTDIICVGIGGSYLGPEFVYEALRTYPPCQESACGRRLRFLANVDPIDVGRAIEGFDPETTLVVVISKTFTTAETMLNARTLKEWLLKSLKKEEAIGCHMAAVSTNIKATSEFGIKPENVFPFWDWVGGRFSVTSAVGCVPLALHFGFDHVQTFLNGCRQMDVHFKNAPLEKNLPVLMGLISFWNSTYLGLGDIAVLPYCQALLRFPAHIQQLTMESNGKRVTIDGVPLPIQAGEIFFGEPGTNGQHSFYQLLHQGRVVPSELIGFCRSQAPVTLPGEAVSNHDELMSNFFAQPDALALGKSADQCRQEGVPDDLVQHKIFEGDRPSMSLLLPICDPHNVGLLLSLYEHRTAVQGFIWNVNSFDQWGVELGKVLAKNVRNIFSARRNNKSAAEWEAQLPSSSRTLIAKYLAA